MDLIYRIIVTIILFAVCNVMSYTHELIKYYEQFYPKAYRCQAGVVTIGYGTTMWDNEVPVKMGQTITKSEANRQLKLHVDMVEGFIEDVVDVPLNSQQHYALVSLVYNVGITNFGESKGLRYLNQGRYDLAGEEFFGERGFNKVNGKKLAVLVERREEEWKYWKNKKGR